MTGLLPDTDYEFHLRLESHAGAGAAMEWQRKCQNDLKGTSTQEKRTKHSVCAKK